MNEPNDRRIKIAVQKSGRLTEHSLDLLVRCGLLYTRGRDQLICYGENMPVDVLLVRDDDIPGLVQEGVCDLGFVGQNIVEERRLALLADAEPVHFEQIVALGFGHCRLSFGVPEAMEFEDLGTLAGMRIATTYPAIVADYLERHGVAATLVKFSGAVEIAPSLGKADVVCDLVSSGSTMRAHHLREAVTILESEAVLIGRTADVRAYNAWIERLLQRLQGVLQVRESKYIMLHAPREALPRIAQLLPGSEAPTIIPLEGRDDRVAVHAVCRENVFWETLEQLKEAGASSMLVLPVEKMLA
jgi:ATP phosphoribosyltransferase